MSPPDKSVSTDEQQLRRYLLGLLPDEEAERLDEASVADDEVASRLRVAENDLVDAYVRGTLAGDMLARFESRYLASPRRREHVKFAARFLRAVDRAAAAGSAGKGDPDPPCGSADGGPRRPGLPFSRWALLRSRLASRLMAAAAALLLLVTCGMLLVQAVRLRNGLNVAHRETTAFDHRARALEQQLADERAASAAVARELEHIRASAASLGTRSSQQLPMAALVLLPQTRAAGPVPMIAVPAGADRVPVELRLESNDFLRYDVALKDPASNRIVWRSDPVAAASAGDRPVVSVDVPARALKPQHYSLVLMGRRATGAEVVGSYTFEVAHR